VESKPESIGRLAALSQLAAPYSTVITLSFIGTLYSAWYTRQSMQFAEYGLSSSMLNYSVQYSLVGGLLTVLPYTILFLLSLYVSVRAYEIPILRAALYPKEAKNIKLFQSITIITAMLSFGIIAGVFSFSFDILLNWSLFNETKIYQTEKAAHIGKILGQDTDKTVIITSEGAVILKTEDILLVKPFLPKNALKPVPVATVRN
jgi:hypothetical protein